MKYLLLALALLFPSIGRASDLELAKAHLSLLKVSSCSISFSAMTGELLGKSHLTKSLQNKAYKACSKQNRKSPHKPPFTGIKAVNKAISSSCAGGMLLAAENVYPSKTRRNQVIGSKALVVMTVLESCEKEGFVVHKALVSKGLTTKQYRDFTKKLTSSSK